MLTAKKQPYNSVWIKASSQKELGNTFIRFQEYYESPSSEFKNKIFTVGQIRIYYSLKTGGDTYQIDWSGFNFPSHVLEPFRKGLFDPLTKEENNLLNLLKYRNDNFYIIGAQNKSVLKHELCHALYYFDEKYRTEIDKIVKENKSDFKKASKYIIDKGYDKSVLNDELQAYIIDGDDFMINNIPESIVEKIITINKKLTYSYRQR